MPIVTTLQPAIPARYRQENAPKFSGGPSLVRPVRPILAVFGKANRSVPGSLAAGRGGRFLGVDQPDHTSWWGPPAGDQRWWRLIDKQQICLAKTNFGAPEFTNQGLPLATQRDCHDRRQPRATLPAIRTLLLRSKSSQSAGTDEASTRGTADRRSLSDLSRLLLSVDPAQHQRYAQKSQPKRASGEGGVVFLKKYPNALDVIRTIRIYLRY